MMGLDNPLHIAFLLVIVLLVFGAKRLPEMGKSLGAGLRGFKESVSGEHDHDGLHDHETLMSVTEHVPPRVNDDVPPPLQVNGDLAHDEPGAQVNGDTPRERTPTQPVA